jgi:hypothetical protein
MRCILCDLEPAKCMSCTVKLDQIIMRGSCRGGELPRAPHTHPGYPAQSALPRDDSVSTGLPPCRSITWQQEDGQRNRSRDHPCSGLGAEWWAATGAGLWSVS